MKTRQERHEEIKQLAATANGHDKLYSILTWRFIPFDKLPIGTLMIQAILDHEYPQGDELLGEKKTRPQKDRGETRPKMKGNDWSCLGRASG